MTYEVKFKQFIRMCAEAKAAGVDHVVIAAPWVLGDTYEELVESLNRLSDEGLKLVIVPRAKR
jgi:dihydrodipicolinate synthase/N-acetylneuraminate lyase